MFIIVITCLGLFGINSFYFLWCSLRSCFETNMPKTPRTVSTAPSTLSRPPVSVSVASVFESNTAPVFTSVSVMASSSDSINVSGSHMALSSATEPLSGGQSDIDMFRKFQRFVEFERSSHLPSGVLPTFPAATSVVASEHPLYSLAPSALSNIPSYPPRYELGFSRSSPILACSRGQEAHVLPQRGGGGGGGVPPGQLDCFLRCAQGILY